MSYDFLIKSESICNLILNYYFRLCFCVNQATDLDQKIPKQNPMPDCFNIK
jgi:hypothetical protein